MHFGHAESWWLIALWPVLVAFLIISFIRGRKLLFRFAESPMLSRLLEGYDIRLRKVREVLLMVGILLVMLALIGPQWGSKMSHVVQKGTDIIIALDTSSSMEARDMKPSRIIAAKETLSGLLSALEGNRIGIIGFSGLAYNFCPLTVDVSAAKLFLEEANTSVIPMPGTSIGDAIRLAIKSFPEETRGYRRLILITDGEDHHSDPIGAAKAAKKEGIVIDTIGIGSPRGEPIPIYDSDGKVVGYKKDKSGKVVMSRLDEKSLKQIAAITGGKYYHASPGLSEIKKLAKDIASAKKKALESSMQRLYEERYQIPLFLGLILLFLEGIIPERKKEQNS
ncbi:MAG: VWA domain-containing protein [Candidatus Eremiobacteraeota bacterium]|nr:VWA domain-containing protein [Candidatus Eremiobacteraeota bacterium]